MRYLYQAVQDRSIRKKRQEYIKKDMPPCYCHRVGIQRYREVSRVFQKKGRNTEQILPVRRTF